MEHEHEFMYVRFQDSTRMLILKATSMCKSCKKVLDIGINKSYYSVAYSETDGYCEEHKFIRRATIMTLNNTPLYICKYCGQAKI